MSLRAFFLPLFASAAMAAQVELFNAASKERLYDFVKYHNLSAKLAEKIATQTRDIFPLHILVFDFGAGTCDISILEIGRKSGKLYSKNIAISKFEQLGGDDIDRHIVKEILFYRYLIEY